MKIKAKRINQAIGKALREHRRFHNETQTEFGWRLGMSQQSYARLEKGVVSVKVSDLFEWARLLNCTAMALTGDTQFAFKEQKGKNGKN